MLLVHSEKKNHSKNIVKVNLDRFHLNSYKYLAKFEWVRRRYRKMLTWETMTAGDEFILWSFKPDLTSWVLSSY